MTEAKAITCPICENICSSQAATCPKCGHPIRPDTVENKKTAPAESGYRKDSSRTALRILWALFIISVLFGFTAIGVYNNSTNGFLWLGIAQKKAGKLVQAEASLKRANDLGKGKVADVHWHLAGLYNEQKRYAEAATELELFLKNKPDARDAEKIKQLIGQLRQKAATP